MASKRLYSFLLKEVFSVPSGKLIFVPIFLAIYLVDFEPDWTNLIFDIIRVPPLNLLASITPPKIPLPIVKYIKHVKDVEKIIFSRGKIGSFSYPQKDLF